MKIAIIGSGISGLSSALLLSQKHDITLFESSNRYGGHANTIDISVDKKTVPVDTGFIVYNELNYPNLVGLFKWLKVRTVSSDMSFGVSARNGELEYSGSLKGLFAQKKNYFNLSFYRILKDIFIFFKFGYKYAHSNPGNESLKEYIIRCKFSDEFVNDHLIPMSSAIWSCPDEQILNFPAKNLLTFFKNHQLLNFYKRPKWRTVKNGSIIYVNKIVALLKSKKNNKLLLNIKIKSIISKNNKIIITDQKNKIYNFDKVVMASHPDQSLKILKNIKKETSDLLNKFQYQNNIVFLHSDNSLMPLNKNVWSSWNYLSNKDNKTKSSVTYWMNILQELKTKKEIFVSLNPYKNPKKSLIYQKINYMHPIFNNKTSDAQKNIFSIQGNNNIYFCGAWTGYGFHEDGIKSAVSIAKLMNIQIPWETIDSK